MTNTLILKNHYIHLEEKFKPYLTQNTSNPQCLNLPHLRRQSLFLSNYPMNFQLYAIIISYNPTPEVCNQQITNLDPRCLTILRRLHNLPNNIHLHNHHITNPTHNVQPNTLAQTYSHIDNNTARGEPTTIPDLQMELHHIPHTILIEIHKWTQPMRGYHSNTSTPETHHNISIDISTHNYQTTTLNIITWNTGCMNSSLPGIQELTQTLHTNPHIILIQETKIHKFKFTTYIDRKLPNCKIIYNNSNNINCKQNMYARATMARGGILAIIPKSLYTNENITKISTPSQISSYLQAILINNKPLTPLLLFNMYMPTHPQDMHLIQEIQNQFQTLVRRHHNHEVILA